MTQQSGKYPNLSTIRGLFKRRSDTCNEPRPAPTLAAPMSAPSPQRALVETSEEKSVNIVSASFNRRVDEFRKCLTRPKVSLPELQNLCFDGVPDNHKLKADCWKLLLGYLPLVRAEQEAHLKKQRDLYAKFLSDLFLRARDLSKRTPDEVGVQDVKKSEKPADENIAPPDSEEPVREDAPQEPLEQPSEDWCEVDYPKDTPGKGDTEKPEETNDAAEIKLTTVTANDDPLCADEAVKTDWKTYFEDEEIRVEIEKDITRTHQSLMFFHKDVPKDSKSFTYEWNRQEKKHADIMTRILMVFAKLNPGIKYVQGMNEILSPIYYVFATDNNDEEWAEADSFYCFMNLMSHLNDRFIPDSDASQIGIIACVNELDEMLKNEDLELWQRLQSQGLDPRYYALRYLSLLLSMEFQLPDVLRLWDSFLGDPLRFKFVTYFVIAMLKFAREDLLKQCFSDNLMLLQQYPYDGEILKIFNIAVEIQSRRHPNLFQDSSRRKSYSGLDILTNSPNRSLAKSVGIQREGGRSPLPSYPAPTTLNKKRLRSASESSTGTFWRNWATRLKLPVPTATSNRSPRKEGNADIDEFKFSKSSWTQANTPVSSSLENEVPAKAELPPDVGKLAPLKQHSEESEHSQESV